MAAETQFITCTVRKAFHRCWSLTLLLTTNCCLIVRDYTVATIVQNRTVSGSLIQWTKSWFLCTRGYVGHIVRQFSFCCLSLTCYCYESSISELLYLGVTCGLSSDCWTSNEQVLDLASCKPELTPTITMLLTISTLTILTLILILTVPGFKSGY